MAEILQVFLSTMQQNLLRQKCVIYFLGVVSIAVIRPTQLIHSQMLSALWTNYSICLEMSQNGDLKDSTTTFSMCDTHMNL